ncbi:hypothetical protein ACRRTK_012715 [Alexandromys fortis]
MAVPPNIRKATKITQNLCFIEQQKDIVLTSELRIFFYTIWVSNIFHVNLKD